MTEKIIGLKELRENMEKYAAQVQKGRSITVVKRSKPLFKLVPIDDDDAGWESIIDFNEIRPGGVPAKEVLTVLDKLIREDEQTRKVSKKTTAQ